MQNVGLFDPLSPHHGLLEAQKTSLRLSRPCETEVTQETHSSDAQGQPPINLNLVSSKLGGPGKLTFVSIIWLVGLGKGTVQNPHCLLPVLTI